MILLMCEGNGVDASVVLHVEISISSLPIDEHKAMDVIMLSSKITQSNDK